MLGMGEVLWKLVWRMGECGTWEEGLLRCSKEFACLASAAFRGDSAHRTRGYKSVVSCGM